MCCEWRRGWPVWSGRSSRSRSRSRIASHSGSSPGAQPKTTPVPRVSRWSSPRRASEPRYRSPRSTRVPIPGMPTPRWSSSSMSWDPPSVAPSNEADLAGCEDLAELVQSRGSTLLDALEEHRPGSRDHADATASYGFAAAVELRFERDHAEAVRETARLHEVGMIYVPARVLDAAPEERDAEGKALLAAHPSYGRRW